MLDRPSDTVTMRALALALVLFGAAGCSSSSNFDVMLFANPGKYEWHTCEQIAAAGTAAGRRERTLKELIEKAEQGAAGGFVSTIAYRGDYRTVQEDLAVIESTARRKNCLTPESWRSSTAIQ